MNVGRIITDFYCGGYFGRCYDLLGAEIIAESDEYLIIRKQNGVVASCFFQRWEYDRHENGALKGGIANLTCLTPEEKKELIDSWCIH